MAIELAEETEEELYDDQPNERGIMDFGFWHTAGGKQRFVPICKQCWSCKHVALSSLDLYCEGCVDPDEYILADMESFE